MTNLEGGEVCIAVIALVAGLLALQAQLRLFRISNAMDQLLMEVRLLRLQQFYAAGHITEEEFDRRGQEILERK